MENFGGYGEGKLGGGGLIWSRHDPRPLYADACDFNGVFHPVNLADEAL